VIPSWIRQAAEKQCRKTIESQGGDVPLIERVSAMISVFDKEGVTQAQIEQHVGKPASQFTAQNLVNLRVTYQSLRNNEISKHDAFPSSAAQQLKDGLSKDATGQTAPQPISPGPASRPPRGQANASGAAAVTGEPSERGLPIDTPDDSPAPDAPQFGFERILKDIREAPHGSAAEDIHRKHEAWINLQATDDQKRQLNDAIEAHYAK
ncbi:MAG: hypothetical protein AAF862_11840, partial [Pseudomonadota bacterium]